MLGHCVTLIGIGISNTLSEAHPPTTERDARLWEIAENLHRAELTVQERPASVSQGSAATGAGSAAKATRERSLGVHPNLASEPVNCDSSAPRIPPTPAPRNFAIRREATSTIHLSPEVSTPGGAFAAASRQQSASACVRCLGGSPRPASDFGPIARRRDGFFWNAPAMTSSSVGLRGRGIRDFHNGDVKN